MKIINKLLIYILLLLSIQCNVGLNGQNLTTVYVEMVTYGFEAHIFQDYNYLATLKYKNEICTLTVPYGTILKAETFHNLNMTIDYFNTINGCIWYLP